MAITIAKKGVYVTSSSQTRNLLLNSSGELKQENLYSMTGAEFEKVLKTSVFSDVEKSKFVSSIIEQNATSRADTGLVSTSLKYNKYHSDAVKADIVAQLSTGIISTDETTKTSLIEKYDPEGTVTETALHLKDFYKGDPTGLNLAVSDIDAQESSPEAKQRKLVREANLLNEQALESQIEQVKLQQKIEDVDTAAALRDIAKQRTDITRTQAEFGIAEGETQRALQEKAAQLKEEAFQKGIQRRQLIAQRRRAIASTIAGASARGMEGTLVSGASADITSQFNIGQQQFDIFDASILRGLGSIESSKTDLESRRTLFDEGVASVTGELGNISSDIVTKQGFAKDILTQKIGGSDVEFGSPEFKASEVGKQLQANRALASAGETGQRIEIQMRQDRLKAEQDRIDKASRSSIFGSVGTLLGIGAAIATGGASTSFSTVAAAGGLGGSLGNIASIFD